MEGVELGGEEEDTEPAQPPTDKPTRSKTPASVANLRERNPSRPINRKPAIPKPVCAVLQGAVAGRSLLEAIGAMLTDLPVVPRGPLAAPVAHAVALVRMVNVAFTALLLETLVLGREKHAFATDGLLDTPQPTVPV